MGHTPGRGHRKKSDLSKRRRFQDRALEIKAEADRRYDDAKKAWDEVSSEARKMRPELDPDLIKPRWRFEE
jgi:hypothetical protein